MYEETFGTDWDRLDREEVLRRAYALGVAEAMGQAPAGELDRLQAQFSARYDQSLVQLAYDEGRTRGRTPNEDEDKSDVWADLVLEDRNRATPRGGVASAAPLRQTDLPDNISVPSLLAHTDDALARLDLPDLLR